MFTRAIVRALAPNFAEGLTTSILGAPDYGRALAQHEAYCAALEQCGLRLTRLAPDPNYPDSTFVEDVAILIEPSLTVGLVPRVHTTALTERCAILTRPGAPSRRGEVESIRSVLVDYFPSLSAIQPPGTLDGGDVCEAGDHFFIGISERTNEAGAQQLAELLESSGYTSSFVDIRSFNDILHLKSGVAYLGDGRMVATAALANLEALRGFDLVSVNADEEYAANCVRVNDHVLVAAGYPVLDGKLRELGYQTITLEMSEFQKMDGGLSCLSLRW